MLKAGKKAPRFSLPDQSDREKRFADLTGPQGLVLYVYPKDNTSGCTAEAQEFRDAESRGAARLLWFSVRSAFHAAVYGLGARLTDMRQSRRDRKRDRGSFGRNRRREPIGQTVTELRFAARRLVRSPGFTLVTVLTLALGIGANVAVFSVVHGVLIRPLPYADSNRLVDISHTAPGQNIDRLSNTDALYFLYREHNRVFEANGLYLRRARNLTGGDQPERVSALYVTHELLPLLGVVPVLGRSITEADDRPGAPGVVLLGDGLWRRRFGGDPAVIGRMITLNGVESEVVGVMPPGFRFPASEPQVLLPFRFDPSSVATGDYNWDGIARLMPGISVRDAEADLNRVVQMLPEVYGVGRGFLEDSRFSARVTHLKRQILGNVDDLLWTLLATVGFVLLIACANVANLFLVRAESRQREVAVRTALGAGRARVSHYFLVESLLLGVLGGVVGLGLAYAGVAGLTALNPADLPRLHEIRIDAPVFGVASGLSLLAALLFGFLPVPRSRPGSLLPGLVAGGHRAGHGRPRHRIRNALVVFQVGLALLLVVCSGLMIRTFNNLNSVDPGFEDPASVLTLRVSLPMAEYDEYRMVAAFHQQVVDRIRAVPGVSAVGGVIRLPMSGSAPGMGTWFEDFPFGHGEPLPVLQSQWVTEGYFEAMGIEIPEGRAIDRFDHVTRTGAVLISRNLARRLWGSASPLGKRLRPSPRGEWYSVVGVTEDVRQVGADQQAPEMVYYPMIGVGSDTARFAYMSQSMGYAVRTEGSPEALIPAVREAVWSIDASLPVSDTQPLQNIVSRSMARTSFSMLMLGIAAAMALLLGAVGIYGVISYIVSQRTPEIGVRVALGATKHDVSRLVLGRGLLLTGVGIALGLLSAVSLGRLIQSLLFGVAPTDPITLLLAALTLTVVSLLATYVPARRAAIVDPVEALRAE